jgi:hypothetical protein
MQDGTVRGQRTLIVAWSELQQNIRSPERIVCLAATDSILDNDCPDRLEAIWK